MTLIRLGHSPDPDDAFMFYALAKDLIPTGEFEFEHLLRDIETLNRWAMEGAWRCRPSPSTPTPRWPLGTGCYRTAHRWASSTGPWSSPASRWTPPTCRA